nr:methylaspartate mutase subunit S [Kordiimonas lipolytica]
MSVKINSTIKVVLGVIGADCHAVGNTILNSFLSQQGFAVINLGVMVSQDEFIDAAIETNADAILVSSIYGHGEIDCFGFRAKCEERGVGQIVLYIGGNLVVGKRPCVEVAELFQAMGFDRVFPPNSDLHDMCDLLHNDVTRMRQELSTAFKQELPELDNSFASAP